MGINIVINAVKKHLKFIFFIPFLCVFVTLIINIFIIKPSYKSTVLIYIGHSVAGAEENNSDFLMYKDIVDTYGKIATSEIVARDIILNTDLNISEEKLLSYISYTAIESTQFLKLSIVCKDKEIVSIISNQLPISLKKVCHEIHDDTLNNIVYMDKPTAPSTDFTQKLVFYIIVFFIFGIFTSLGMIILFECTDNRIKTEDDLSKLLSLDNVIILPVLKNQEA